MKLSRRWKGSNQQKSYTTGLLYTSKLQLYDSWSSLNKLKIRLIEAWSSSNSPELEVSPLQPFFLPFDSFTHRQSTFVVHCRLPTLPLHIPICPSFSPYSPCRIFILIYNFPIPRLCHSPYFTILRFLLIPSCPSSLSSLPVIFPFFLLWNSFHYHSLFDLNSQIYPLFPPFSPSFSRFRCSILPCPVLSLFHFLTFIN